MVHREREGSSDGGHSTRTGPPRQERV
jgi:hypothetical protein